MNAPIHDWEKPDDIPPSRFRRNLICGLVGVLLIAGFWGYRSYRAYASLKELDRIGDVRFGHKNSPMEITVQEREVIPASLLRAIDLSQLDTVDFSGCRLEDLTLYQLRNSKSLRKLDLGGTNVTDQMLLSLGDLPKLEDLYLAGTSVSEVGLAQLSQSPLRDFKLGQGLTDHGLPHIGKMRQLYSLEIHNSQITASGVKAISGFPELVHLSFAGTPACVAGLENWECPELLEVVLFGMTSEECWSGLRNFSKLDSLEVYGEYESSQLTGQGIAAIRSLPITKLEIVNSALSQEGIDQIGEITTLKSFKCDQLQNRSVQFSGSFSRLESLMLLRSNVSDDSFLNLGDCPNLVYLDVEGTGITGTGFLNIKAPLLESLKLSETKFTDEGVRSLKGFTALKELYLRETKVTGIGFRECALPIEHLDLTGCPVTDKEVVEISKLSTLRSLSLAGTQVTDEGVKHLAKMTQLTQLDLIGTAVTDGIQDAMIGMPNLNSVYVAGTQITDEVAERIDAALKPNRDRYELELEEIARKERLEAVKAQHEAEMKEDEARAKSAEQ